MDTNNPSFIGDTCKVKLISITPDAEKTMAYVARVSSKNQDNPKIEKLLAYCAKHGHWSVMEQAFMTVEVICPLAVSIQMIRHRSFTWQQMSSRYQEQTMMAELTSDIKAVYKDVFYLPDIARLQDTTNRQNSIPTEDSEVTLVMNEEFKKVYDQALESYTKLIDSGIAKEVARFVLPQGVYTRLYMSGTIRSFIHYIDVRSEENVVQSEHIEVANKVKEVFKEQLPIVSKALGW